MRELFPEVRFVVLQEGEYRGSGAIGLPLPRLRAAFARVRLRIRLDGGFAL